MIEITKYTPVGKNTLVAKLSIKVPKWGGFFINEICYFQKGNQCWISLPSQQYESNGEKKYHPLNGFSDPKTARAFQDHILIALENYLKQHKIT